MPNDDDPIAEAVKLFARMPGVGEKSARRMVYALLQEPAFARALAAGVSALPERVRHCALCGTFTGRERCSRCADPQRDHTTVCVVTRPWEADAIERAGTYRGLYHVLHALLDPMTGAKPTNFPLEALLDRVREEQVKEIIIATPSTLQGEATALYLAEALRDADVMVTRIASGVPHGGELEFLDPVTVGRALEGRRTV